MHYFAYPNPNTIMAGTGQYDDIPAVTERELDLLLDTGLVRRCYCDAQCPFVVIPFAENADEVRRQVHYLKRHGRLPTPRPQKAS
jgi:hypothetical protein